MPIFVVTREELEKPELRISSESDRIDIELVLLQFRAVQLLSTSAAERILRTFIPWIRTCSLRN